MAAFGADFSHALHLKLKPECVSCHVKATSSTKLEDNLLPVATACAPCHPERQIKEQRTLRLKNFDHALHTRMGNIAPLLKAAIAGKTYLGDGAAVQPFLDTKSACAACHHGIEQSTSVSGDAGRAHYPHMADCLVCHNKIDPPFSCEQCHGVDKTLKPAATHPNDWLDRHTRKSEKVGCAVCHGQKFTCLGCH